MDAKQEILKLKDGETWVWPESDYGKAEVLRERNSYLLFEIPSFGGEPIFSGMYSKFTLHDLIDKVNSWT